LCAGLHAFTHVYWVALTPLYLLMREDLGLASVSRVTLLMTVMMTAYFLPSYPVGMLADRFPRKHLLAFGLLLNGAAFVGLGCAPNYGTALACAALAGLGGTFYHPAATALVAGLFPLQTGRALGIVGIGASVGFFAGPIYSGWRAEAVGWRGPVIELGVAGVVMAMLFLWRAREPERAPVTPGSVGLRVRLGGRHWLALGAAALFLSLRDFAGTAVGSGGALFLQQAHGFSPARTGVALSLIFLGSAVGNPLFGHLGDRRLGFWLTAVLLIAGVAVMLMPWIPGGAVPPLLLAYGFFFMGSYPMTEAAVVRAVPDAARGRVMGGFITVGGLIGNLGHWWAGDRIGRLGAAAERAAAYGPFFFLLGALMVAALLALPWLLQLNRIPLPAPSPEGVSASHGTA
jgi:MFS family permease